MVTIESNSLLGKEIFNADKQKEQIEEKIKAAEEISKLILENAARREIVCYITEKNARRFHKQREGVIIVR
jgi:hypothetical protein